MTTQTIKQTNVVASSRFPIAAIIFAIILIALFILPIITGGKFIYHVVLTIFLFGALSTAWNITGGFVGQLSLGHGVYYGIGAYAGIILMNYGVSPWIGMFAGAAVAIVASLILSYPCLRLQGAFFTLASIAFLEVFRVLALHFRGFTGGATGLMPPMKFGWAWMMFREPLPQLIISAGLLILCLAVAEWVRSRRIGFYLIATRERESAAKSAGVNTTKVRLIAISISAALTAFIGTFHGIYLAFIDPESVFSLQMSIQIAMFALIGGLGTISGPLLGSILMVPIMELTRIYGGGLVGLHGFIYGCILMLVVLFMPNGLIGLFQKLIKKPVSKEDGAETTAAPIVAAQPSSVRVSNGDEIMRVENLDKRFGGLHVTKNVSFKLREGEVLGLIGPNGAGKTTLFNMLSGFLSPDSGSVKVRDTDGTWKTPNNPADFAAIGVGRTFQIVQPFAAMSVEENIMVGAFARTNDPKKARDIARETAYKMGLGPWINAEARGLTIGGLKRLEVARVMAMKPRILLLDEVMAGINQTDVRRAIDLILSIRDTGVSVIAIEHVMQAVMALSDHVIVLNSGTIITEGKPDEVVRDPEVIEAYLGKEFINAKA